MAFDFKNASPQARAAQYRRIAQECDDDRFFTRKELKYLPQVLVQGEQVLAFASGLKNRQTWLIVLTDRRVIFLNRRMFFGHEETTIDLARVARSRKHKRPFGHGRLPDRSLSDLPRNSPRPRSYRRLGACDGLPGSNSRGRVFVTTDQVSAEDANNAFFNAEGAGKGAYRVEIQMDDTSGLTGEGATQENELIHRGPYAAVGTR